MASGLRPCVPSLWLKASGVLPMVLTPSLILPLILFPFLHFLPLPTRQSPTRMMSLKRSTSLIKLRTKRNLLFTHPSSLSGRREMIWPWATSPFAYPQPFSSVLVPTLTLKKPGSGSCESLVLPPFPPSIATFEKQSLYVLTLHITLDPNLKKWKLPLGACPVPKLEKGHLLGSYTCPTSSKPSLRWRLFRTNGNILSPFLSEYRDR
jgi:hypothetical protein